MKKIQAFIVGAQKTGSTSIFNILKQHPQICGHEQTELNFFHAEEYLKGEEFLHEKYYPASGGKPDEFILGKHVMAMYHAESLSRIKKHNAEIKVIVCLRDSVERALSAYTYALSQGLENELEIEKAFKLEDERLKASWKRNKSLGYVNNGLYGKHLQMLFSIYDESQVLVVTQERLKTNTSEVINDIIRFLKIPDYHFDYEKVYNVTTQARSRRLASIVQKVLRSQGLLKRISKLMVPASKRHVILHSFLKLNKGKANLKKPQLPEQLRQELKQKFELDRMKLPAKYRDIYNYK